MHKYNLLNVAYSINSSIYIDLVRFIYMHPHKLNMIEIFDKYVTLRLSLFVTSHIWNNIFHKWKLIYSTYRLVYNRDVNNILCGGHILIRICVNYNLCKNLSIWYTILVYLN